MSDGSSKHARAGGPPISAAKAAMLVTVTTYLQYALSLVAGSLLARDLGPEEYGRYAYVVWLAGLLIIFSNHGLTTSGIRFVSEYRGRGEATTAARIHGWLSRWHVLSTVLVLLGFCLCAGFVAPVGWNLGMPALLAIVAISVVSKSTFLFDVSIAKGYRNFTIDANTSVIVGMLSVAGTVALVVRGSTLLEYLVLFALSSIAYWALAAWKMRRVGITKDTGELPGEVLLAVRSHLGWTILLVLVAAFNNKAIETFLLNKTGPAEAVGFFSVAAALTRGGADLLMSGLSAVLMPSLAHAFGEGGTERVKHIVSDMLRLLALLGLVLAGVGFFIAYPAIDVMYGPAYDPAVWVFQVMIVVAGLTLSEGAFGALLTTTGNQRTRFLLAIVSVVVTAAFSLALIPGLGLAGAIYAHAASRVFIICWTVWWTRREFDLELPLVAFGKLLLAAAAGFLLAAPLHFLVGGVLGGLGAVIVYLVCFMGASVVFRTWTATDYSIAGSMLHGVPVLGAPVGRLASLLARRYAG